MKINISYLVYHVRQQSYFRHFITLRSIPVLQIITFLIPRSFDTLHIYLILSQNVIILKMRDKSLKNATNASKPLTVTMQWSSSYVYGSFQKQDMSASPSNDLKKLPCHHIVSLNHACYFSIWFTGTLTVMQSVNYTNWTAARTLAVENQHKLRALVRRCGRFLERTGLINIGDINAWRWLKALLVVP